MLENLKQKLEKKELPEVVQENQKNDDFKTSQVISDDIAQLLIVQLGKELENHNLYSTFGIYYNSQGLFSLAEYYLARANEEYDHHLWVKDYLSNCNIPFAYPAIKETEVEIDDNFSPLIHTIEAEIETTSAIKKIYKAALDECDFQTTVWLQQLLEEQIEEESLSLKVYNLAKNDTDWVTIQDAIMDLYNNSL